MTFNYMMLLQAHRFTGGGNVSPGQMIKLIVIFFAPFLAKLLKLNFLDKDGILFFNDIVSQSMKERMKPGAVRRNDFIDLILEALKDTSENKPVEDSQFEKDAIVKPKSKVVIEQDEYEELLIANALVLFLAGFDTSSTAMTSCCYFLARYQEFQDTLMSEVDEVVEKAGSCFNLDYNTVQGMTYLDMFIHETLRMNPVTSIERQCVKDYKFPGTNLVIPKGTMVTVPALGIMKDKEYFPFPEEFNPENFSPENKAGRSPYVFLAFGQGPRNCIGMRFALFQMKMAIIQLLANFRVLPGSDMPKEYVRDPMSINGLSKIPIKIKLEKRI